MELNHSAKIKVFYLFLLASGLFFVADIRIVAFLAGIQFLLWLFTGLGLKPLWKAFSRVKWFLLLVIISYLLIPPAEALPDYELYLGLFTLKLYFSGLEHALLMLSRILLLVLTSVWVRLSEPGGSFVTALRFFRVPQTVSIVIDAGLSLCADRDDKKKNRKGKTKTKTKINYSDLKSGKFGFLDELLKNALNKSRSYLTERYPQMSESVRHDAAIILAIVVAVMSLKLLQLFPGLPIAPGHKNIIVIPLLVMAVLTTKGKFGGISAGFAVGIVSFLMGYGKFGIFEVLHFAIPGLMADLLVPILVSGSGLSLLIRLTVLGALIGLTRFAANFMILMLAGLPEIAAVVFIPMLISQVVFGGLSCLVCIYIVNKHRANKLLGPDE